MRQHKIKIKSQAFRRVSTNLDEKTSGLQRSDLIIVAARPGWAKPPLHSISRSQSAVKHGTSAIIFSLEMSKEQLGQRLLAMQARVEMQKLKQGDLDRKTGIGSRWVWMN